MEFPTNSGQKDKELGAGKSTGLWQKNAKILEEFR